MFLAGIVAAAVVGALAIGFLLRYLQKQPVGPLFVWYRVAARSLRTGAGVHGALTPESLRRRTFQSFRESCPFRPRWRDFPAQTLPDEQSPACAGRRGRSSSSTLEREGTGIESTKRNPSIFPPFY